MKKRGFFVVVDGLDCVGKGVIEDAIVDYEEEKDNFVFDVIDFSKKKGICPDLEQMIKFGNPYLIRTAEPSYFGVGKMIREEITAMNGRDYSAEAQINAYSLDRLIQMKRTIIPALDSKINVLQSRCCASTLTYQSLKAESEGKNPEEIRKKIIEHEGNILQMQYRPDLLIIPTIKDTQELIKRLSNRIALKNDNSIFENFDFQSKLKPLYESDWLREFFEKHGTKVEYIDANISVKNSKKQALDIYNKFKKERESQ